MPGLLPEAAPGGEIYAEFMPMGAGGIETLRGLGEYLGMAASPCTSKISMRSHTKNIRAAAMRSRGAVRPSQPRVPGLQAGLNHA